MIITAEFTDEDWNENTVSVALGDDQFAMVAVHEKDEPFPRTTAKVAISDFRRMVAALQLILKDQPE